MDISTNHDPSRDGGEYGIRLYEECESGNGCNTAEVGIYFENFIDSRTELDLEIKKKTVDFLRRAADKIEAELNKA